MLTHKNFGEVRLVNMWTNPWTREMWGSFITSAKVHVNLPLREVTLT